MRVDLNLVATTQGRFARAELRVRVIEAPADLDSGVGTRKGYIKES